MANSMTTLSRRLYRSLLSNPRFSQASMSFCTNNISSREDSDFDELSPNSDTESPIEPKASDPGSRFSGERPLENGLDSGVFKAILVGQVGQLPLQKKLKSGRTVTLFSVGTGGIRNNRRPLINEDPREYASRSAVQWHRVSVYPERLADLVLKTVEPGTVVYLEGNLETKIFTDPVTGLVRRIREVAIRRNGRVVFLGKAGDMQQPSSAELRGVGYY
ncbi:PREDICTED: single-stranded DNA-binding protein, mitochondrial-like [Camelina sativa]|uniref:Single-stranded DNA-binding protein, mitochondrial-like n=1 Tax=Camelina sativa TaxID=90675 RepID=A0ABM0W5I1_CAMSA|nr:PREDICTED: single-stranded DNA-binding protein, mitochondrial-like [Camelina sativa]